MDTGLCGTVSSQRTVMPKALRPAMLPLNKGDDRVYMRNGKILACKWHGTKRLTMLSTIHGSVCVQKQIRAKHIDRGYRDINRPVCVDRCNAFLGGVDAADQRRHTFSHTIPGNGIIESSTPFLALAWSMPISYTASVLLLHTRP